MSSTRDFKSLGVWAEDAITPVPGFPTPGVAYRDDTLTDVQNKAGEPFDTKPDSAQFNKKMFTVTSFTDLMDRHGIVGWTDLVDYAVPAYVWASDNRFYEALQASGPSTAPEDPVDEVDPINTPVFWELITSATKLRRDLATSTPGSEGARIVDYNKFDINGGSDEPLTVKEALDEVLSASNNFNGLQLRMAGRFDGITGLAIGNTYNIYQNKAFKNIIPGPGGPHFEYRIFADTDQNFSANQGITLATYRGAQDPLGAPIDVIPAYAQLQSGLYLVPSTTENRQGAVIIPSIISVTANVPVETDIDFMLFTIANT